jgi:hypothetical protein
LILTGIAQPSMHGLHRLPLAVIEQPVEILTGGLALRLAAEAGTEPIQKLPQASQQFPGGSRRHARSVRNAAGKYKRNRGERAGSLRLNLTK